MNQYSLFVNWNVVNRAVCSDDVRKAEMREMWVPECPVAIHADLPSTRSGVIEYFHVRLQRWLDEGWTVVPGTLHVSKMWCFALLETKHFGSPVQERPPFVIRKMRKAVNPGEAERMNMDL